MLILTYAVLQVPQGRQALKVLQVPKVLQVIQDQQVLLALKVRQVHQALPHLMDGQATAYGSRTLMVHGVHTQTFVVLQVLRVHRVLQVPKVRKVTLVQLVRQDLKVFRVQ